MLIAWPIAQAAAAEIESSQITAPTDASYLLANETLTGGGASITVAGTTTGSGTEVDIRCYYNNGASYHTLVEKVSVVSNAFSVAVAPNHFNDSACVLRAVPAGYSASLPTPDPFNGPRIGTSYFELNTNELSKLTTGYFAESNTLTGAFEVDSAGECGLESFLYSSTFAQSEDFAYCNSAIYSSDGSNARSDLQIDGVNAYGPTSASRIEHTINEEREAKSESPIASPGQLPLSATEAFDPKTGLMTIHEVEPIVKCAPQPSAFPAKLATCPEFASTGVQLERTWQFTNDDHVAWMTDTWHSTDSGTHSVNALYFQEFVNAHAAEGAYEFPGTSSFVPVLKGQKQALPAGAGTILYKALSTEPEAGDGEYPQGALVYDSAPGEPLRFYRGTNEEYANWFEMPYQYMIPAGGSHTLRMAFVQGNGLAEVRSLAEAAQASYYPSVSIVSPSNGTTTASPTIAVSGTAADSVALSSLTVNGQSVTVGASGIWSTTVALSPGANTITATATNQSGLTKSSSVTVTYTPPSPPPAAAHATQVGSASGAKGKVSLTLACAGPAGSSCHVQIALTSIEKLHGNKLIAVIAKAKAHSKKVVISSVSVTIEAGARVKLTISLNATGRKLLAKFGKLPAHLSAILKGTPPTTIVAQNLTIKPAPKKHRKHKR